MKKLLVSTLMIMTLVMVAFADTETGADIKFEKTTIDVGEFPEESPVVKTEFKFTNTGNAPLIIHQAVASCGCTIPQFTKEPIKAGETGVIEVTYNGRNKFPGKFKKSITIRTNSKHAIMRLFIEGEMLPKK